MKSVVALVRLARPSQWSKNVFVITALVFSGRFLDIEAIFQIAIAVASFCLASSSTYFLNDYRDLEEDKLHPKKSKRPLAAGILPPVVGPVGFMVMGAASLALSYWFLGFLSAFIVGAYLAVNLSYSFGLKHVVIIDVLLLSTGFVLRILAGAAAIHVMPSNWLIVCGVTISLFLGFTKRRTEVVKLGDNASNHRKVLSQYNTNFLDQMISIVTAATLVCYILYTVDDRTLNLVGSQLMLTTVPFVIYGIFRYLYLAYQGDLGGDPTTTVFKDIPLVITGALWALICMSLIVWGQQISTLVT